MRQKSFAFYLIKYKQRLMKERRCFQFKLDSIEMVNFEFSFFWTNQFYLCLCTNYIYLSINVYVLLYWFSNIYNCVYDPKHKKHPEYKKILILNIKNVLKVKIFRIHFYFQKEKSPEHRKQDA